MCGIAGIVRFDRPATASAEHVRAMRARLAHRGPDGVGEAFASFAALGHTRLAMVDRAGGAQPFSDGRYTLVYNGELYDHEALRAQLPGPWRTRSDTETVLAAWRAWGEACVERLDGMYAFFIWDDLRQVGFAVRDRLGVKPLAFTRRDGFAFASEAQALMPVLGRPRANADAIVEYLVAPAFSGVARSPFAGVEYLQPGHVLCVAREGITTRRYWRWQARAEQIAPEELRATFEHAIRSAIRSDAPLGVFASGGLDSTAIAAVARRELGALPSFTIAYPGADAWRDSRLVISDDTPFARDAARELDLEHHELAGDPSDLAAVARVNDALPAWEQELSQRALARAASAHVKGVLVGDAADETHYGYHFLLDLQDPAEIIARLGAVPVRRDVDADPIARLASEYRALGDDATPLARTTRLIVERWLPRLLHNGDIHCMAYGLEARVPFAATPLVELAARVDPALAMDKRLLREALRGVVPETVRMRRKSALPKDQAATYRAEARHVLADPHPLVSEFVDLDAVAPLMTESIDERGRAQLFRIVGLHHWAVAYGL